MQCPVLASAQDDVEQASDMAQYFDLPFVGVGFDSIESKPVREQNDAINSWVLVFESGRVRLLDAQTKQLLIDDEPPKLYQVRRRDILGRAIGSGRAGNRTVIDATAGLGTDAIQMAMMGFTVVCIERCKVAALLLNARLNRLPADIRRRLSLINGDSLEALATVEPADVVYMDPMYPPKRKASALPPLEIQVLRQLVGNDDDATTLFSAARKPAQQRIVVKRPLYAPPLSPNPQGQHAGKLVRYDVYPQVVA